MKSFTINENIMDDGSVNYTGGEISLDEYKKLMCHLLQFVTVTPSEDEIEDEIQERINRAFDYEYHNDSLEDISEKLSSYQNAVDNIECLIDDIRNEINNI